MKRDLCIILPVVLLCCLLIVGCQPRQGDALTNNTDEQVLNLYGVDPLTLDPAVSGEMTSHGYVMQLFGGLVRLNDNLEPAPDIARKWEVNNNGMTYTFYLRDDVQFHNGRGVKAEDTSLPTADKSIALVKSFCKNPNIRGIMVTGGNPNHVATGVNGSVIRLVRPNISNTP